MAIYVGETGTETVDLAVAAQTFVTDYSTGPAGGWTPTITEPYTGGYTFTKLVTLAGTWVWTGTSSITGDVVTIQFDVDANVVPATAGARLTTLAELRRRAADNLFDLTTYLTTALGTTTTFIDVRTIQGETMNGRELVFTSGSNIGQIVRITGTNQATNTATFAPAVSVAVAAGTTLESYNKRSKGYQIDEYRRTINRVISESYPLARPLVMSSVGSFDDLTRLLTIPAGVEEIYAVEYQGADGFWHPIRAAQYTGYAGWTADQFNSQIEVGGPITSYLNSYAVRVIGYGRHQELASDADTTSLHPEYIVAKTTALMAPMGMDRVPERAQLIMRFDQQARALQTQIRTRRNSGSRKVRGV